MEFSDISSSLQNTFKSWDRVLKLSRKPKREEFMMITKVTGLGALVVGAIGFLIRLTVQIIERLS